MHILLDVNRFDQYFFNLIHSSDCVMNTWSKFCLFMSNESMWVWIGLAIVLAFIAGPRKYYPVFMCIGGFFFVWHFNDELLKPLFERVRPPHELGTCVIGKVPHLDSFSFPSGHTITAFAFATLLWLYSNRNILATVGFFSLAIFQGYLRIFLGVHYLTDVMAGAVFGIMLATFWYWGAEWSRKQYSKH